MALFSQGNWEAVNNKIRICTKCQQTLIFSEQDGFCCPICHRCWLPKQDEADKTYTHPAAVYRGGAVVYKGTSKGRKRKKPPKKTDWAGQYGDS